MTDLASDHQGSTRPSHPQQQQQFIGQPPQEVIHDTLIPECSAERAVIVVHTQQGYQSVLVPRSGFQEALQYALAQMIFRGMVIYDLRRLNAPRPGMSAMEAFTSAPSVDWAQRIHQRAKSLAESTEFQQSVADRVTMLICALEWTDIVRAQKRLHGIWTESLPSSIEKWIDPLSDEARERVLESVRAFLRAQN